MSVANWIKDHPYATGGVILGVGVVLILLLSGGSSDSGGNITYATDSGMRDAYDTQLQMAQIQAQSRGAEVAAQSSTAMAQIMATLDLGKAESARQSKADDLAASVATAQIAAQVDTQKLVSSLSAQVQQQQIEAQRAIELNNQLTQFNIAKLSADTTTYMADISKQMNADNQAAQLALVKQQSDAYIAIRQAEKDERIAQAAYDFTTRNNMMSIMSQAIWANAGNGYAA